MTKGVLGIIGGSGIYDLPGLTNAQSKTIDSPWGKPSAALQTGEIAGLPIIFLSRQAKGHRLSPSDINYRTNIDVLKRAGVTDLVSLSACGSFKEELPPGTFVLIDQFVDRTHARASSFFGTGCVAHVSIAYPVSPLALYIQDIRTSGHQDIKLIAPDFESLARMPRPMACCTSARTRFFNSALAASCSRC